MATTRNAGPAKARTAKAATASNAKAASDGAAQGDAIPDGAGPDSATPENATSADATSADATSDSTAQGNVTPRPGTISVTIPLDRQLVTTAVSTAVSTAMLPVTAVRRIAKSENGLPAYLTVGGLAVVGVLEWPVAAAAGAGLVALRRWGPLRPATSESPVAPAAPVAPTKAAPRKTTKTS